MGNYQDCYLLQCFLPWVLNLYILCIYFAIPCVVGWRLCGSTLYNRVRLFRSSSNNQTFTEIYTHPNDQ
uniref:Uncharacterized protein n=1 Tax=Lutzomyia longipalpis TaxID=7200 RepID=A0A7G3B848_LUTLO